MARNSAIWGIDIGQSALKALRCRPGDDDTQVVADAFDYIEYPKILSQPEAEPEELIAEALKQFLSRNSVRGDRVAISVTGQSGLARFIKLPPVESKKIPDIVKYEARQQIPFALEDVVWDYQQMPGGSEEDGFALETEVGLFAMKREQVFRALAPFDKAGIEVDFVQLAPLALYNFIAFDQMQDLPPPEEYDPEAPPPSVVLLSLGTDTTDLVVTNGYRVWQRSIPIGGNHFTRALTKELKLTFARAEHLKRNAAQAENAKVLFQAMRPVFNDLLTQVQRSIDYFSSLDRRAKLSRIVGLGNAMKLPGLQRYLQQNLGMEVQRIDKFRGLTGPEVVDAPAFKDNLLAFATGYGLTLQGLVDTKIRTNLVPPELVKDRLIRDKKPWAVAAAALLLLGFTFSLFGRWGAWRTADVSDSYFGAPMSAASRLQQEANGHASAFQQAKQQIERVAEIGDRIVSSVDDRTRWLNVMTAINAAIPRDPQSLEKPLDRLYERDEVHILSIDCAELPALDQWFSAVEQWYVPVDQPAPAAPADGADEESQPDESEYGGAAAGAPVEERPTGPGWVFQLKGYHYHNKLRDTENEGPNYLRNSILKNLASQKITLPDKQGKPREFTMKQLGISHPVLIEPLRIEERPLTEMEGAAPIHIDVSQLPPNVRRFDFTIQFCWREPPKEDEAGEQGLASR